MNLIENFYSHYVGYQLINHNRILDKVIFKFMQDMGLQLVT